MTSLVDVSQADRDAAAKMIVSLYTRDRVRAGQQDDHGYVQSFARHRLTAEQAKDAEIRNHIPMDYLERHPGDLGAAMRDYAEDRWKLIDRLKQATTTIAELTALLRKMLNAGWSHNISEDVRGEMDALLNKGRDVPASIPDARRTA